MKIENMRTPHQNAVIQATDAGEKDFKSGLSCNPERWGAKYNSMFALHYYKAYPVKVEFLDNGQVEATNGKLTLVQTKIGGSYFNDCSVNRGDTWELVPHTEEVFTPLFIAIHNAKNQ